MATVPTLGLRFSPFLAGLFFSPKGFFLRRFAARKRVEATHRDSLIFLMLVMLVMLCCS